MRAKAKKAMIIGIDCMILPIVDRLSREGKLPNIKALMERGVIGQTWPEYPTATQPNWNVVQTGAYPGTSGIYDMTLHIPGDPLDEIRIGAAFESKYNKAETLWQLADRLGKKCFLFKFPGTWPPSIKNGYQIDGHCAPAGILHNYFGSSKVAIHPSFCYSTEEFRRYHKTDFKPAVGWKGLSKTNQQPLETELPIAPGEGQAMFYGVIVDSKGQGYDTLIIDQNKNAVNPAARIKVGEYSPMIKARFAVPGKPDEGAFRVKLMELAPDGKHFKLYSTQVYPTKGFTHPESLAQELVSQFGPFIEYTGLQPYALGWIDEETFLTDAAYHTQWMQKAAAYVFSNYEWDLFMMQWHPVDFSEHLFFHYNPSCYAYDPKMPEQKRRVVDRCYQMADGLIGSLVSHANADTLIAVVSDHGVVPAINEFMINDILANRGYLALKKEIRGGREWLLPDWSKTKAWAQYGWSVQIHLNLKGRDPEGIVEPGEEYEKVRESIIHDLHNVIDYKTGRRPVLLALKKEHAQPFFHTGEMSGDVIYALDVGYEASGLLRPDLREFEEPHYSGIHSSVLPNASLDEGTIQSMFIIAGPGVQKGIRLKKPTPLVNFAPTIAYALNLPPLANADGMPLVNLFEY